MSTEDVQLAAIELKAIKILEAGPKRFSEIFEACDLMLGKRIAGRPHTLVLASILQQLRKQRQIEYVHRKWVKRG